MTVTVVPRPLSGRLAVPPSKSQGHRFLISAALAQGDSLICNLGHSQDIDATRRCLEELGAGFAETPRGLAVHGMGAGPASPLRRSALPRLDCGESGSTLRFLIPVALAVRGGGVFTGRGRLMERPMGPYLDLFREKGVSFEQKDGTLKVQGLLEPGVFHLPGDQSSQFFSGLLFALPLLGGASRIQSTTHLESREYVALTAQAMEAFGVKTAATLSLPPQYHIPAPQRYRAAEVTVEGDWSQAGFWAAANALGSQVTLEGLDPGSLQGDKVVLEYLRRLERPGEVELDLAQCPDLAPPLAAVAAARPGRTRFTGAGRLRAKESDRLHAVAQALCALGGQVTEGADSLEFEGVEALSGGVVDPKNDHRIAMMAAVAASRATGPVTVLDAQCVDKSYPAFWRDYERVGGTLQWNM